MAIPAALSINIHSFQGNIDFLDASAIQKRDNLSFVLLVQQMVMGYEQKPGYLLLIPSYNFRKEIKGSDSKRR